MPKPDLPETFTAARSGLTSSALRHRVRRGQYDRLQLGVFAAAQAPHPARYRAARNANLRAAFGAGAACERAALSHASSAIAWDLPVVGRAVLQPCVTVQSGTALRSLAKVHLHRATLDEIELINGFRALPIARTVSDLAREHGAATGLAAADAALHLGLITREQLVAVALQQRRWPGGRTTGWVAGFADGRIESPLESMSRFCMHRRGLPAPRPQARIVDESGEIVARADFYWEEYGVVGESDGAMKWENDPGQRDKRDAKTYLLEDLGLIVVRWGWPDLRAFAAVERRLRLGFARGARPGSPLRRWRALPDDWPDVASGIVA